MCHFHIPVGREGVEPSRCHHRRILSPLRLPIPPPPHGCAEKDFTTNNKIQIHFLVPVTAIYGWTIIISAMQLTLLNWFLAILPVLVVIVLMMVFKWSGSKAGVAGLITGITIAMLIYGTDLTVVSYSVVKAVLLALDVLLVVWTALLLYNIANEAGAIRMIGEQLPNLTSDRVMQTILIGWLLVTFLQGMGGFGVPIAICAPILVGMGFAPVQSVVMAAIGHAWAVNFGTLASAFQALLAVTGLPGELLAPTTAFLLGACSYFCGAIIVTVGTGWKGLKHAIPALLILGTVMSVVQYVLATNRLWTLGTTGAGIAGLLVSLLVLKLPMYRDKKPVTSTEEPPETRAARVKPKDFLLSMSAYLLLVILGFSINMIPPLKQFLSQVKLSLTFPELVTSHGWLTAAGPGRVISVFSHPGIILLYTCAIAYLIYLKTGLIKKGALKRIFNGVKKSGVNASLGVITLVSLASIMSHAGMNSMLARGLSETISRSFYPAVSPLIGAMGAFITGSNNNSNILFAVMQMDAAELLQLPVPVILAAQTAGGSIGSIMSPGKVIVGCSTVGLTGREGEAIRRIMFLGLIPISVIAILATIFALVMG